MSLAAIHGQRLAVMSRDELMAALESLWLSYMAISRARMQADPLGPMPTHDVDALEARLKQWFYGPDPA